MNYPMIVNKKLAAWLKSEGMWSDKAMIEAQPARLEPLPEVTPTLPTVPSFLMDSENITGEKHELRA